MQATYHGGLTGKARSIKNRNRVERIRAQQLLDEYFDVDGDEQPRPHVRLGSRADFLPTVDAWSVEPAGFETGDQFELSLGAEPQPNSANSREEVAMHAAPAAVCETEPKPSVKVIPTPYWAKPKLTFQPQGKRVVPSAFDVRRFLCGCALGTAAAAAILVIVSTVVH